MNNKIIKKLKKILENTEHNFKVAKKHLQLIPVKERSSALDQLKEAIENERRKRENGSK